MAGLLGYHAARLRRPQLIAWGMALIAPLYVAGRVSGVLSPNTISFVATAAFGSERGHSLSYRLQMEGYMIDNVWRRPLLGYGSFEGGRGRGSIITDGLWMITLGQYGMIGVAALYATLSAAAGDRRPAVPGEPLDRPGGRGAGLAGAGPEPLHRRQPAERRDAEPDLPDHGRRPGRARPPAGRRRRGPRRRGRPRPGAGGGRPPRRGPATRRGRGRLPTPRRVPVGGPGAAGRDALAAAWDRLADLLEAGGRGAEAEAARRRALALDESLAAADPAAAGPRHRLARGYAALGRGLAARGAAAAAVAARERALASCTAIAAARPADPVAARRRGDALNDLAWLLAEPPDPAAADPRRAVALAEQAVRIDPGRKAYWNTLGAAYCRAGDPAAALAALERSRRLGPLGAEFDDALIALAHARRGAPEAARAALDRLDARPDGGGSPALRRIRAEAASAVAALAATADAGPDAS